MKKILLSLAAAVFMFSSAGIWLDKAEAAMGTNFVETYSTDKDGNRVIIRKYTDGGIEQTTYAKNKTITINKYADGVSDKMITETVDKNTEIITKLYQNGRIKKSKVVYLDNGRQYRKTAVKKPNGSVETYEENVEKLSDGRVKKVIKKPNGYQSVFIFTNSGNEVVKSVETIKHPDGRTEKIQTINQNNGTNKVITTNSDGTQTVEIKPVRRI